MKTKKPAIIISALIFLILGLLYFSPFGGKESDSEKAIHPPIPEADIPYQRYLFCNDSLFTVRTATGSSVSIPAGIFEKNSESGGACIYQLEIREIHDAWDIFRTGISMQAGLNGAFLQSAGMIDIRVTKDGQPVKMRSGEKIDISLASYRSPEGYRLYHLEDDQRWRVRDSFRTDSNRTKFIRLAELARSTSTPDTLQEDLDFQIVANLEEVPYLRSFDGLTWHVNGKENREQVLQALRMNWDEIRVKVVDRRKMDYQLTFSKKIQQQEGKDLDCQFSVIASPKLDTFRKRAARKLLKDKMEEYELAFQKAKEEEARLKAEADLQNQFRIDRFGIWNIDRICNDPDFIYVEADFDIEREETAKNKWKVFAIYEDLNTVLPFERSAWKKLALHKKSRMKIIAVPDPKTIAVADQSMIEPVISSMMAKASFRLKKMPVEKWRTGK